MKIAVRVHRDGNPDWVEPEAEDAKAYIKGCDENTEIWVSGQHDDYTSHGMALMVTHNSVTGDPIYVLNASIDDIIELHPSAGEDDK